MDIKQKIEDALKSVDFPANWDLENTSKSFAAIKQTVEEHLQDVELFSIEDRFFESYLYMSEFKGIIEKDIKKAEKKNDEAFAVITELDNGPIKDGYKSIYLAMRCWFAIKRDQPDIKSYEELEQLLKKYNSEDEIRRSLFQASICATKAFALSKLAIARYEESEHELKVATESCPKDAEWLFKLGLIKWRRHKHYLQKTQTSPKLLEIKPIMNRVLELKSNHAYAMVVLADIRRREYEYREKAENTILETNQYQYNLRQQREVICLLTKATHNTSRPKILSIVAQCFIRMGAYCKYATRSPQQPVQSLVKLCSTQLSSQYFEEARKVIDKAKNFEIAACIINQEAVLYREQDMPEKEIECLDQEIEMNPSNTAVRFQKAQALERMGKHQEIHEIYDNLLVNFKDSPFDFFQINQNYAMYLVRVKEYDEVVSRNETCLKIALESFVKKTTGTSGQVEFIDEEKKQVQQVIGYLKTTYAYHIINANLNLAEIHVKLGQYEDACSYYREALHVFSTNQTLDKNKKMDIQIRLAKVNLKSGNLTEVDEMLETINGMEIKEHKDNIGKLKIDLAVAKGKQAVGRDENEEGITQYARAADMGSLEGAMGLLQGLKGETNRGDFFKNCALIKKCIETASEDKSMLENDLDELVNSYDEGCVMKEDLRELRRYQLEMEYAYLIDSKEHDKIVIVINKARNILNYAIIRFRNEKYASTESRDQWKGPDFVILVCPAKEVKTKLVNKLEQGYGWKNFQTDFKPLFDFLVSIQPATNPSDNNWMRALRNLDNKQKHQHSLRELIRDPDGELVYEQSKIIDIARTACLKIRSIVDEFCKYLIKPGC